jgi:hypothetical protein
MDYTAVRLGVRGKLVHLAKIQWEGNPTTYGKSMRFHGLTLCGVSVSDCCQDTLVKGKANCPKCMKRMENKKKEEKKQEQLKSSPKSRIRVYRSAKGRSKIHFGWAGGKHFPFCGTYLEDAVVSDIKDMVCGDGVCKHCVNTMMYTNWRKK